MFSRATVMVSSARSYFASMAKAARALTAAFSGCAAKTASVPVRAEAGSYMLEVPLVVGPVEDAFLPDVEEADGDESQVDEHLIEAEHARAGDDRKAAIDDGPGKHEDSLDIEEDEEHRHQVEAHREAAPGVA